MEKTFTVAGTSILNGVLKARFANDIAARDSILKRNGHVEVKLMTLPQEMTKEQAVRFLSSHKDFEDINSQAVITAWLAKNTKAAPAVDAVEEAPKKTKKTKASKSQQAEIDAEYAIVDEELV